MRVLFVCVGNAGRSQMSEAFLTRLAGPEHAARSAGTAPSAEVHPEVVEVMREVGIDLAGRIPQKLTDEMAQWADIVVTMGCGDSCPYIPGKSYLDWEVQDPMNLPVAKVRLIRDGIEARVRELLADL